eukprot:gene979-2599_t
MPPWLLWAATILIVVVMVLALSKLEGAEHQGRTSDLKRPVGDYVLAPLRSVVYMLGLTCLALMLNCCQLLSFVVWLVWPRGCFIVNSHACMIQWYTMQWVAERLQGFSITISGDMDKLSNEDNAILVASPAECGTLAGWTAAAREPRLQLARWFTEPEIASLWFDSPHCIYPGLQDLASTAR